MSARDPILYEFGPFRLDAIQRLLFRDSELISVSPKALETLLILVRHHGQLVEKDELIRQVWPSSVVEESNLAIQISALRKILTKGMPEDPIATIPKRGYRFVARVHARTEVAASEPAPPAASTALTPAASASAARAPASAARLLERWPLRLAALVLIGALIVLLLARPWQRPPSTVAAGSTPVRAALTERDSVLLADVQNETGEAVFDDTLRQALSIQLEQSPFLTLVSDQQIQRALILMQQPRAARLTPQVAWELCVRTGSAAVIYTSIANLGEQYILGLRATDCRSGDSLANQQIRAQGKDHVLMAVDQAATALRTHLGESLAQIEKYNIPIEEATTPSLTALEAYSQGWLMNYRKGDSAAAIDFYRRAIQQDPNFAMAYAALGTAYANQYQPDTASQNLQRAYALREHVSEREKYYIEARYQQLVTGDLVQARQINAERAQVYPRDAVPYTSLSLIDRYLGQYERAQGEAETALRLSPDSAQSYANLAFSDLLLNRLGDAQKVAAEWQAHKLDSPLLRLNLYFQDFLLKDEAGAAQLEAWAMGQRGVEDRFMDDHALQYAYKGQFTQGQVLSERAIASAQQAGEAETAAGYRSKWAKLEALVGKVGDAAQDATAALRLAQDRDTSYDAALALALAGEEVRARAIAEALAKQFPNDTLVQDCYLPTIRAVLAMNHKDFEQALQSLERNRPYELGKATNLYPVYVRGLALLGQRQPAEAAAEFQKVLDRPGVVSDDPIGPLARLQLARARAMQGLEPQARSAYENFLTLWQDADPQIPALLAARAEYAQLQ